MSRKKRGRELRLESIEPDNLAYDVPLRAYNFETEPGRRTFVFVLEHEERAKLSHQKLEEMAQQLGNGVYPNLGIFLVLQPGAGLSVYEVRDPGDTARHGAAATPKARQAAK